MKVECGHSPNTDTLFSSLRNDLPSPCRADPRLNSCPWFSRSVNTQECLHSRTVFYIYFSQHLGTCQRHIVCFLCYYLILHFKRKKRRWNDSKIKGAKIISPFNIQTNILCNWQRGYHRGLLLQSRLISFGYMLQLVIKETAAFPLLRPWP